MIRNYTYKVIVKPVNKPISLSLVKQQLRIDNNDSDDLLNLYIDVATEYVENFTSRYLITRTVETYRDYFPCWNDYYFYCNNNISYDFILRRSPLQSVLSIQYYSNGSLELVDSSVYYNTIETDYSKIIRNNDQLWPQDVDNKMQSIIITFTAGFGDNESDIPSDYKNAILQIVNNLYENRGDCSDGCSEFVSPATRSILLQNRIIKL